MFKIVITSSKDISPNYTMLNMIFMGNSCMKIIFEMNQSESVYSCIVTYQVNFSIVSYHFVFKNIYLNT